MSWRLRKKSFPKEKPGPFSSMEALEDFVDNPGFTPDIDEAWKRWKKRSLTFLLGTIGLAALCVLVVYMDAGGMLGGRIIILTFFACISLPFVTLLEWATTKEKIEQWNAEQRTKKLGPDVVKEKMKEKPVEKLRWLYIGDRKW